MPLRFTGTGKFFGKHRWVVADDRSVRNLSSLRHDHRDGEGGPVRGAVSAAVADARDAASDNDR
jgi:hypothetical protein